MGTTKEKKGLNISAKSFITATVIIFVLMVLTYILTFLIPGGQFARTLDANGNSVIDTAGGFSYVEDETGRNIRSIEAVEPGQELLIRVQDGNILTQVCSTEAVDR